MSDAVADAVFQDSAAGVYLKYSLANKQLSDSTLYCVCTHTQRVKNHLAHSALANRSFARSLL